MFVYPPLRIPKNLVGIVFYLKWIKTKNVTVVIYHIILSQKASHSNWYVNMYISHQSIWCREDNVDYNELHHYDQVTLLLNEVKQRITYGSTIPNLCRCRRRPMVLFDKHNAELNFESIASLNVLYELWKDSAMFEWVNLFLLITIPESLNRSRVGVVAITLASHARGREFEPRIRYFSISFWFVKSALFHI